MYDIPKIIWMVWFQGADTLPTLTRECVTSWEKLNPGWEVRVLDNTTIPQYIDVDWYLDHPHIPPQALSDIVRIFLLQKYGGVWVDASVFCARPLDEWIYDVTPDGFFAFSKPRKDKLLSSWFLVASKDNYIIQTWHKAVIHFWKYGPVMPRQFARLYHKGVYLLFKLEMIWFVKKTMHFFKRLSLFPYFWVHYLFDGLYDSDQRIKDMWDAIPKISADGPHRIIHFGLTQKPSKEIIAGIAKQDIPVYKLSWRTDITDPAIADSAVLYLIDETKKRYHYDS